MGDPGRFNLQIDGSTAGTGANVGNGGTTGVVILSIGSHTVGETAFTGTSLSDYTAVIGGDCTADGSITLAAGENKACFIINTRNTNTAPNAGTINGDSPVDEGSQHTYSSTASDPDAGDTLLYTWSVSSGNATINGSNSGSSVTLDFGDGPSTVVLHLVVDDQHGHTASPSDMSITVNNVAPTIALSGADSVDEGSPYTLTLGAVTDPGNDTIISYTIHWGDGTSENFNGSPTGTQAHTYADGPNNYTITVDLTDEDGTFAGAGSKAVTVNNVPPTVTASFPLPAIGSCNPLTPPELTVNFTDPGVDTHTATVDWGDGSPVENLGTVTNPFSASHTYVLAGMYHAKVTVTDSDGDPGSDNDNDFTVNFTIVGGGVLPPINQDGTSVFKFKSTIPTKIKAQNCDGSFPANLAPTIALKMMLGATPVLDINEPISISAADTSGIMRFTGSPDYQYIYNLATKPLPDPSATYQIKITIPATGQMVTVPFGLKP